MLVIQKLLQARQLHEHLFTDGAYEPLQVRGRFQGHCVSFERTGAGRSILVLVPRLASRVGITPIGDAWGDTHVLPVTVPRQWVDVFTGARHEGAGELSLAQVLKDLPFTVLFSET